MSIILVGREIFIPFLSNNTVNSIRNQIHHNEGLGTKLCYQSTKKREKVAIIATVALNQNLH